MFAPPTMYTVLPVEDAAFQQSKKGLSLFLVRPEQVVVRQ